MSTFNLSTKALAYAKYWKTSLIDADLGVGKLSRSDIAKAQALPIDQFSSGTVSKEIVDNLFRYKPANFTTVDVVIYPVVYSKKTEHTYATDEYKPLTMAPVVGAAKIDREGRIYPQGKTFIARDILNPLDDNSFCIGDMFSLDEYLAGKINPVISVPRAEDSIQLNGEEGSDTPYIDQWSAFLHFCNGMTEAVLSDWMNDGNNGYLKNDFWLLKSDESQNGTKKAIVKLYDDIEEVKPFIPLFDRYADEINATVPCIPAASSFVSRVGHSNDKYPLSIAQRDSVTHLLNMQDGEILAVNGPPGTGKTTMLLSAIASLWVKAALYDEYPPVIVAASANNQAVTNIIDAFGHDFSSGTGVLAGRWLPDITSFGSYFPAQQRSFEAEAKYQTKTFFDQITNSAYVRRAKEEYLKFAKSCFPELLDLSVDATLVEIKKLITAEERKLNTIHSAWSNLINANAAVLNALGDDPSPTLASLHSAMLSSANKISNKEVELDAISMSVKEYRLHVEDCAAKLHNSILQVSQSEETLAKLNAEHLRLSGFYDQYVNFSRDWDEFKNKETFLFELMDGVKIIRRKRNLLARNFINKCGIDIVSWSSVSEIDAIVNRRIRNIKAKIGANSRKIRDQEEAQNSQKDQLSGCKKEVDEGKSRHHESAVQYHKVMREVSNDKFEYENEMARIGALDDLLTRKQSASEDWQQVMVTLIGKEVISLDEADASLDTTVRFRLFQLATHYWEGRWLQEASKLIRNESESDFESVSHRWHCRMMLTPCVVSTLYTMPNILMCLGAKKQKQYLYDFADLLIIDEAGQVLPEVGGATFALAKKALVIGDTLQIEPIKPIPPHIDVGNLIYAGLIDPSADDLGYKRISTTGKASATGSVMRVAQYASRYHYKTRLERGLYLFDHRRCYNEIIEYCNDLCYEGNLIALRGFKDPASKIPAMGYLQVDGICDQDEQKERSNIIEADAIANWIFEHKDDLEGIYKNDSDHALNLKIHEIVAVITPFRKQVDVISRACRRRGLLVGPGDNEMTVGTIHSLQGSERPVVIFSPTYSRHNDGAFIDRNKSLLNVTVSRAKDSFLVFGDMATFDKTDLSSPRGLLALHLFKNESNNLEHIPEVHVDELIS